MRPGSAAAASAAGITLQQLQLMQKQFQTQEQRSIALANQMERRLLESEEQFRRAQWELANEKQGKRDLIRQVSLLTGENADLRLQLSMKIIKAKESQKTVCQICMTEHATICRGCCAGKTKRESLMAQEPEPSTPPAPWHVPAPAEAAVTPEVAPEVAPEKAAAEKAAAEKAAKEKAAREQAQKAAGQKAAAQKEAAEKAAKERAEKREKATAIARNAGATFNFGFGNVDLFVKKLGPNHAPHDVQGHKMPDIEGNKKRIKDIKDVMTDKALGVATARITGACAASNIPKKWHIVRAESIRDALVAAGVPKDRLTIVDKVGGNGAKGEVDVQWKD